MATIQDIELMRDRLRERHHQALIARTAEFETLDAAMAKIDQALLNAAMAAGSLDDVIATYVATRDEKEAVAARHKEELAVFNERLRQIEQWLLTHLATIGAESIRAKTGTAFTKSVTSTKVDDRDVFFSWVLENNAVDMLEARCSKLAVEAHLDSTGELPPGISRRVDKVVTVNRPSAKH